MLNVVKNVHRAYFCFLIDPIPRPPLHKLISLLRFKTLCLLDTASQGLAPLVAMETPLGSGAAPIFVFLCIALRQTVLPVGDSPVPTACVGGKMGACACACFCDWERVGEKRRERSKQGGRDWENGRERGGKNDKERNEWWRQWVENTHAHRYRLITHPYTVGCTHILQQRWLEYVRVSEQGECVGGGMPQQCSLFCLQFDPCNPLSGASHCITSSQFAQHDAKSRFTLIIITHESLIMTLMIFRSL